jgi:hypothetical protein
MPFCKKLDCDTKSEPPYIPCNHPSAIFLESFDNLHGEDNYLLGIVFPYLESFHLFGYGVSTYVQHKPFGRIRCITCNHLGQFKMLFLKCSSGCKPSFCDNEKLKMKQKIPY